MIIQTAFLGDVILTTGLVEAVAEQHGPVDVLVAPEAVSLIDTHPSVRETLVFDKRRRDRGLRGLVRRARALGARGYVRVYLPHRSFRSALLSRLAGIPERVGFADARSAWLYTRRIRRPRTGHEAERLIELAEPAPGRRANLRIALTANDRAAAYAWLADQNIGDGFVAMAPGSIWATKRWGGYPALARRLQEPIVVLGGPDDAAVAEAVVEAAPDRVANAAGRVSLRVAAALLERAGVLVTNDSAPLHLASAVGTPVVAIFGPTVTTFGFGPRGPRAAVVERTSLPCRPCSSHGPTRCPLGHHRCMTEIPPEAVLEAVDALTR